MKNILILAMGIMLLFINLSCKKYLDKKSNSTLTVPSTVEDLQALLDLSQEINIRRTPSFGEASSDDYFLLQTTFDNLSSENKKIYTWVPHIYNFDNDWSKGYLVIYNSNFCLESISKIPLTSVNESKWKNLKGSALFLRAYYFLELTWVFSKGYDETTSNTDLGIALRLTSDFNIPSVRATVKESYDRIIQDAKESIQYLPDNPLHSFRPSKVASYGLLARTYLSMRQYDSAFKYSNLCLQLKSNLMDYNADNDIYNLTDNVPFKEFNKEVIFFTSMTTSISLQVPARARVDTLLYNSYDNNDLRKIAFFRPNGAYRRFKGSYAGNPNDLFTGIATDEMYLIRAECYAKTGNVTEAMNDLNTLLRKRWNNTVSFPVVTAVDAADAVNKIRTERRKELLMRGLRWPDIKRYNKETANLVLNRLMSNQTYTLQPNSNYYALPLPNDVILQSGMPQNQY